MRLLGVERRQKDRTTGRRKQEHTKGVVGTAATHLPLLRNAVRRHPQNLQGAGHGQQWRSEHWWFWFAVVLRRVRPGRLRRRRIGAGCTNVSDEGWAARIHKKLRELKQTNKQLAAASASHSSTTTVAPAGFEIVQTTTRCAHSDRTHITITSGVENVPRQDSKSGGEEMWR
eukprot:1463594-Rhodomonas_salina.1